MSTVIIPPKSIMMEVISQLNLEWAAWGLEVQKDGTKRYYCEVNVAPGDQEFTYSSVKRYSTKECQIEAHNDATMKCLKCLMVMFNFDIKDVNYHWKQQAMITEHENDILMYKNEELETKIKELENSKRNMARTIEYFTKENERLADEMEKKKEIFASIPAGEPSE